MTEFDFGVGARYPEVVERGPWTVQKMMILGTIGTTRWGIAADHPLGGALASVPLNTCLVHADRGIVMSDTLDERNDLMEMLSQASARGGAVLVNGGGLGLAAHALLALQNIVRVVVAEIDLDVVDILRSAFEGERAVGRLRVVHADARDVVPELQLGDYPDYGKQWTVVWHDIWDTVSADNLPEMDAIEGRYRDLCDWQGCWARRRIPPVGSDVGTGTVS